MKQYKYTGENHFLLNKANGAFVRVEPGTVLDEDDITGSKWVENKDGTFEWQNTDWFKDQPDWELVTAPKKGGKS